MAQTLINFPINEKLKNDMEQVCEDMGMTLATAFTMFAVKVANDRRIPFDVSADPDPFYADANTDRIKRAVADVEYGRTKLVEHELVEAID